MNLTRLSDLDFVYQVAKYVIAKKVTGKMVVNLFKGGVTGIQTPENWKKEEWEEYRERVDICTKDD